jgi:PIN domain nuclease of toxin-antitoxin system
MSDERYVLDASALLAMLGREPGGDAVAMVLGASAISAVNWSVVVQKAQAHGVDVDGLFDELRSLGLELVDFGLAEAEVAAQLWARGARHLALADRACLATAMVHDLPVMTADQAWATSDVAVRVELIR